LCDITNLLRHETTNTGHAEQFTRYYIHFLVLKLCVDPNSGSLELS